MRSLGYGVLETEGSSDGRIDRVDSCGLYFRSENWQCLNNETIRLDDLAILRSSSRGETGEGSKDDGFSDDSKSNKRTKRNDNVKTNMSSLKGFERSFVRKNVTLVARMEHKSSKRQMVIVVSHLFWNPAYDYVKVRTTDFFSIHITSELGEILTHEFCIPLHFEVVPGPLHRNTRKRI